MPKSSCGCVHDPFFLNDINAHSLLRLQPTPTVSASLAVASCLIDFVGVSLATATRNSFNINKTILRTLTELMVIFF